MGDATARIIVTSTEESRHSRWYVRTTLSTGEVLQGEVGPHAPPYHWGHSAPDDVGKRLSHSVERRPFHGWIEESVYEIDPRRALMMLHSEAMREYRAWWGPRDVETARRIQGIFDEENAARMQGRHREYLAQLGLVRAKEWE